MHTPEAPIPINNFTADECSSAHGQKYSVTHIKVGLSYPFDFKDNMLNSNYSKTDNLAYTELCRKQGGSQKMCKAISKCGAVRMNISN